MDHSAEFETEGATAPSDKMDALNEALEEAIGLEEAAAQMEEDLKATKKALHALKSSRIPDLMDELQISSIDFRGWAVKIADFVSGTLPKEPAAHKKAILWLEDHGAGGLIKTDLSLSFGRSQHNEALDLAARLEADGLAPNVASGVHPQTLKKFALDCMRNGDELDTEVLGLYIGKVANIKASKE